MEDTLFVLQGQKLHLNAGKVVFWEEEQMLIVSDIHFGKISHFRKSGIGIPSSAIALNFNNLRNVISFYSPRKILFLGDLFHSTYNEEWPLLQDFIAQFPQIQFLLLLGNHDILTQRNYQEANLILLENKWIKAPFVFTHEPIDQTTGFYQIAGHIHPGIKMSGKGLGSVTIPCFFFSEKLAILPAFGYFTGLYKVKPRKTDTIFGVLNHQILKLQ